MSRVVFTAVRRFDPSSGDGWTKYIEWSRLTHLKEIISLDIMLCPNFFGDLTEEDWKHNVQHDHKIDLFHGVEYVLHRVGRERVHVLALIDEPSEQDIASFSDPRFVLRGFDLLEDQTGISALVNCGGFEKAFVGRDLSGCGLIVDLAEALRVQARLRAEYPDQNHAYCRLWAIWQMLREGGT